MISEQTIDNTVEQGIASYVSYINNLRLTDLINNLNEILINETKHLSQLAQRQSNALGKIHLSELEINDLINSRRGGERGVHGFIAEFAETGIANAKRALYGLKDTTELLNNNGAADLLVKGKPVQMKFYQSMLKEIQTSSGYKMDMMFPKGHINIFKQVMHGDKTIKFKGTPLSNKQITNIRQAIENESNIRGEPWSTWMRPSQLNYEQVQKNRINDTLHNETKKIKKKAKVEKQKINKKANSEREIVSSKAKPSLGEASKVAGIGAAVQGGLNFGLFMYKKHKEGKEVWDFSLDDWKECGLETANGSIKGGISGYAIYGLTNVCNMSAPSAGAIASGTFGLTTAILKFRSGEVDADGFIELVTLNTIDSAGAAVGAAVGQVVVPIPVVGALLGSIVVSTVLTLGKNLLNKYELRLLNEYYSKIDKYTAELDNSFKDILDNLMDKYKKLGELQTYAFDIEVNVQLQFANSVDLARYVGVNESCILHNENEIDDYFRA